MKIKIEISARHIHLSKNDSDVLFGEDHQFTKRNDLSQPNQFAANETVDIESSHSLIKNVRIVCPLRAQTQLEISKTDVRILGINVPVLVSGDLKKSAGNVKVIGPEGEINLESGVIIAQRHLHIETEIAKKNHLNNGDLISILVSGIRSVIFNNVAVRSRNNLDKLSFQVDTDEANAAGIDKSTVAEIIK